MRYCIILALALFDFTVSRYTEDNGICETPICYQEAARIRKNMDTTVDPCDNFYQFACGNYVKETKIPNDKSFANIFTVLIDDAQEKIAALITASKKSTHIKPFRLLRGLYKQCMNEDKIERDGLRSFLRILEESNDWPVRIGNSWNTDKFDWKETVYSLRKLGINLDAFLTIQVEADSRNSSQRIITIDQPSLGLQQEILVNGFEYSSVKAYYDYMVNVAVALGADHDFAKRDLKESLNFEIEIAKISISREEWWNATALYNPMTVRELYTKYPGIIWLEYINNIFNTPHFRVKPHNIVSVNVPKYLTQLEKLLELTPKRVQANYIMWRTVHYLIPFLTKELRQKRAMYEQIQNGNSAHSRKQYCLDDLSEKMEIALGALYTRNYFSEDSRKNARIIVDDLISAFTGMLQELDWPDEETIKHALDKASAISKYVGYSDEMLDDNALTKYYKNLHLTFEDYLMTSLNLTGFLWYKHYKQLQDRVNKTDWTTRLSPLTINAIYSPLENSIQVPAAILQNIFFDKDRPQYLNYGAIGYVIGHEITHGFDDFGKHYDKNGNLADWWTEATNQAFVEKSQCFIKQYDNFSVSEIKSHLSGRRTLNENIADNGGLIEAYLAYGYWKLRNGSELLLPGLEYNTDQLFWISAANIFCTNDRREYLKLSVMTNPHSPLPFRILGSFSNTVRFADDFNCPENSQMNPEEKCEIW